MRKLSFIISLIVLSAFPIINAEAESSKVQVISLSGLKDLESTLYKTETQAVIQKTSSKRKLNKPLKLRLRANGVGRFDVELNSQTFFNIKEKDNAFLQGAVKHHTIKDGHEFASFATIEGVSDSAKKLRLFVSSRSRVNKSKTWKGLLEIRANVISDENKVSLKNLSVHRSKRGKGQDPACINHKHSDHTSGNNEVSTKATVSIAKIVIDADLEYESQIDGSFSTELATIMNGVDAIYQRDLGLSFSVNINDNAVNYTSRIAYAQNDTIELHNEMKVKRPASSRDANIHFLFTGKVPVGNDLENLAGVVADLGTVCRDPANSVGLTIRIDTATDIVVTAHEIGHLYNAEHDDDFTDPDQPNIMSSVVSSDIERFSNYSMNQINNFVSNYGSCLTSGEGGGGGTTPPVSLPATADIYSYKDGKYFVVELYDVEDDSGYEGYSVDVLFKAKARSPFTVLKRLTTDEDGVAYFKPKKVGTYAFQISTLKSRSLKYTKPRR